METNLLRHCSNCDKPVSSIAFFCGNCLAQIKCKSCGNILNIDDIGCTNCGTPKEMKNNLESRKGDQNINKFRLEETLTHRIIEASFSDTVGKDFAGIIRDASLNKTLKSSSSNNQNSISSTRIDENSKIKYDDAELFDSESSIIEPKNLDERIEEKPIEKKDNPDPNLKSVTMKNLPNAEKEWVLIYSFYASDNGKKTFNRESIIELYKSSNRFKDTTKRDLSSVIKILVKDGFINPLGDEYSILQEGIDKAKEIITRTKSSPPKLSGQRKIKKDIKDDIIKIPKNKKNNSRRNGNKLLTDINFFPSGKESLKNFINKYKVKNNNERNLLFVYYLSDILKIENIDFDHLYTCYDEVDAKIPENMESTLTNTKTRTGWIEGNSPSIKITTKGINKIKFWNKEP